MRSVRLQFKGESKCPHMLHSMQCTAPPAMHSSTAHRNKNSATNIINGVIIRCKLCKISSFPICYFPRGALTIPNTSRVVLLTIGVS